MEDEDEDEDVAADKKGPGGLKSAKKSAGKKIEVDDTKKGKKRKADGDAEKGPKQKKKKEEPKPKAPKQKGILFFYFHYAFCRSSESKASPPYGCGSAIAIDSFLIGGRLALLPLQIFPCFPFFPNIRQTTWLRLWRTNLARRILPRRHSSSR